MPFLTKEELKTAGVLTVIENVTNGDDTIITQVIEESIDLMKTYLSVCYDADLAFSKEGDQRSLTLLKFLKIIVIYWLYKRKPTALDQDTVTSYDEAILWLKDVSKGVAYLNIPKKETNNTNAGDGFMKLGGKPKYSTSHNEGFNQTFGASGYRS